MFSELMHWIPSWDSRDWKGVVVGRDRKSAVFFGLEGEHKLELGAGGVRVDS